jgi:hypothetical protein
MGLKLLFLEETSKVQFHNIVALVKFIVMT